jgi:hypothetical protein
MIKNKQLTIACTGLIDNLSASFKFFAAGDAYRYAKPIRPLKLSVSIWN